HSGADQRRADRIGDRTPLLADPDNRHDEREPGGGAEREPTGLPPSELTEPQQGGRPARDEEEGEEEAGGRETRRRQQAAEVERHPGYDEVDGDEKPEADSLEPHAHDLSFRRVQGEAHD